MITSYEYIWCLHPTIKLCRLIEPFNKILLILTPSFSLYYFFSIYCLFKVILTGHSGHDIIHHSDFCLYFKISVQCNGSGSSIGTCSWSSSTNMRMRWISGRVVRTNCNLSISPGCETRLRIGILLSSIRLSSQMSEQTIDLPTDEVYWISPRATD